MCIGEREKEKRIPSCSSICAYLQLTKFVTVVAVILISKKELKILNGLVVILIDSIIVLSLATGSLNVQEIVTVVELIHT